MKYVCSARRWAAVKLSSRAEVRGGQRELNEEGGVEEEEASDRFISTAERHLALLRLSAWFWRGRCRTERNKGGFTVSRRSKGDMDALALEASGKKTNNAAVAAAVVPTGQAPAKRKPAKKTKKAVVFFEVEILDAKTKDKLCFLDKVRSFSSNSDLVHLISS